MPVNICAFAQLVGATLPQVTGARGRHMDIEASQSAGLPGGATDHVGSARRPRGLRDTDTCDSTECCALSFYPSLLSIWLDVQIKKSTRLKAGCKA